MKKRKNFPVVIYLLVLLLLMYGVMRAVTLSSQAVGYSDIVELFEKEQVRSFVLRGDVIRIQLHTPLNGETEL